MEPFVGQIMTVGFNFPPRGWALCDGQLLPIAQNTALFSLLGTTFGGDGRTTFALPDLRGRVPLHVGNGPGVQPVTWGQRGGTNTETLSTAQIPSHTHPVTASTALADDDNPKGRVPAVARQDAYVSGAKADATLGNAAAVGNNQSHNNMQPYLGVYTCIALVGIFPSRN